MLPKLPIVITPRTGIANFWLSIPFWSKYPSDDFENPLLMNLIPIIDSHLDLAWNAVSANRDLGHSIEAIRAADQGLDDFQGRREATTSWPELKNAGVRLALATVMGRWNPEKSVTIRMDLSYRTAEATSAFAASQWEYYELLQRAGKLQRIETPAALDAYWEAAQSGAVPQGYILAMEGADAILDPDHVATWFSRGVRVISLSHYGIGTYAVGTGASGPLRPGARDVMTRMRELGIILDVTHLSEPSFVEAMDFWDGPLLASHQNCRALVPGERQFSDEQLRQVIARGGVIGTACDNWMLTPDWKLGATPRDRVTLNDVADHMDHVCQLAGNDRHAAIGTDLDGGYGTEQSPSDLNTIADLQKLAPLLSQRGYSSESIERIFHGNWLNFFRTHLPVGD